MLPFMTARVVVEGLRWGDAGFVLENYRDGKFRLQILYFPCFFFADARDDVPRN
jgi:hypothetical protein